MQLGHKAKRALVTGASRGIGRAITLRLASEGAAVTAVARASDALSSLMDELGDGRHGIVELDLVQKDPAERIASALSERDVNFDIIINNLGGTLDVTDPFCSIEDWRAVMRLNFEVAVEINRHFVRSMQANGWGRIVNIASIAAAELNGPATYAASKAALTAYTRCVGRLLAKDGVIMTAVLPGVVKTEGGYWEQLEISDPERVANYLADRCPLGRLGGPNEIADIVLFLCSERSTFVPGAVWPADGGQLRGYEI